MIVKMAKTPHKPEYSFFNTFIKENFELCGVNLLIFGKNAGVFEDHSS